MTQYNWCPVTLLRLLKTCANFFSSAKEIAHLVLVLGLAGWVMLVMSRWVTLDSWCNSQIVALVSVTHLGTIYNCSSPH